MMPGVVLRYGSLVVRARARHEASLRWIVEFLAPAFDVATDEGDHPPEVEFDVDPGRHAALDLALAHARRQTVDVIGFDGHFSHLPSWTDDAGTTWAFDAGADAFYGVSLDRRAFRVVVSREESYERVAWMRVIRELATSARLHDGDLPVHAAAFAHRDGVVLVCGPKRSGKTSLLVGALRSGAAFVANDRVFVTPSGEVAVRAMPTIVALRTGTLDLFPDLREPFDRAAFDRGRTIAECAAGVRRPSPTKGAAMERPGISPAQLGRLTGAALVAGGPLRAILFAGVDPARRGVSFDPMTPAAAAAALDASLLAPSRPIRESEFFTRAADRFELAPDAAAETCRRLVSNVFVARCVSGSGAFESDWVRALDERTRTAGTGVNA